ncbi:MAG: glycosyltransferase [Chloroflexota bacterium]
MSVIPYRLGIQQRILPNYRAPFFEALGEACPRGLGIFAGLPRPAEAVEPQRELHHARLSHARNLHLLGGRFYLCWQAGWRKWLEDWQPEILILEANPRYLSSPALMRWMRTRGRPLIGWGLGAPLAESEGSAWGKRVWRGFLRQFDALIAYSRRGAEQYARLGFARERIVVAPNAVAPRPLNPPPERPPQFEGGRARLLYVGRLQARKRVDLLLRACAALPAEFQPEVWIVGDGPVRAELEELAARLYPACRFWGARFGGELEPLFQQADVFVLPGSGGLAVQQAMAYALPVIVGEADGTQSELVTAENGWLLAAADLSALTAALGEALSDAARLRRMGLASYRIVRERVNLEAMVAAFARAVELAAAHGGLAAAQQNPAGGG